VIFGAFIIVYLPNRLLGVHFLGINMGDLKIPVLRPGVGRHDDLPARGPVFRPPATAGLRQGRPRSICGSGPADKEPAT